MTLPAVAGLPVDQHLGNLEGKELRFGTSAGATYAAVTTDVTCGSVNAEEDSLNPMAGLSPMIGMWLNCVFGGKGVGMINMLIYVIIGIFVAGMMVGRTPEYLGKKIGAKRGKTRHHALLVHPIMILVPTGLFAATSWGLNAVSNPGPHGLSQMLYQFSSASANNGSAFDGLGVATALLTIRARADAMAWDIATGLVMLFSRYLPIIAPSPWRLPRREEIGALRPGHAAERYPHLRRPPAGDDPHRRRPALPAGRRPGTAGRTSGPDPLRRLTMLRKTVDSENRPFRYG